VLRANPEEVYIVEGELDACALVEVGIPATQVLAAHGAKDKPTEGDPIEQPGYAYVKEALEAGLGRARKFIWCGDADDAGCILRDDMVRMLGAARFYFVEWPEGVKDANDMLLSDGLEELLDRVQNGYLPWPVADIYQLGSLPEPAPMMTLWYPGFDEWERKVRLAPRTLSVVTGHTRVMPDRALEPDLVQCGQALRGRPHRRGARGGRCLDQRSFFFWCTRPTADAGVVSRGGCDLRHGVRIVHVDPCNRLEASRGPGERDDGYVLRCCARFISSRPT
jgi:twinkle protein